MDPLVWALVLLLAGLVLAVLELFLPSGGMLGVAAFVLFLAAIWMGFRHGPWTGMTTIVVVVLGVPGLVSFALRVWPETPIGRRLMLDTPTDDEVRPDSNLRRSLKDLEGKLGVARSLMTPNGAVEVAGQMIDAVSQGDVIEPGRQVRVVEVRGTRVIVRPYDAPPTASAASDPLAESIESLGLDPFEDPLA
jgi:membrane-bound serine protease (ClpP class)